MVLLDKWLSALPIENDTEAFVEKIKNLFKILIETFWYKEAIKPLVMCFEPVMKELLYMFMGNLFKYRLRI